MLNQNNNKFVLLEMLKVWKRSMNIKSKYNNYKELITHNNQNQRSNKKQLKI